MISFHKNTLEIIDSTGPNLLAPSEEYCHLWFNQNLKLDHFQFTKSCSQSLELALLTLNLPLGSEVILPSYAFVSLANAINNLGLKCIFVDCEASTMNIDATQIEQAITPKTKALICINYGGVSCDYGQIKQLCKKHNLFLVEDNAHGILGKHEDQFLGSLGDISCFSFDHLKNFTCYQGGGIAINNSALLNDYYIASEFGTNRKACLEGKVDFYEWRGRGSNSILAKPLYPILKLQLEKSADIVQKFNSLWQQYQDALTPLQSKGFIELLTIPDYAHHNAHMFWIKTAGLEERHALIAYLLKKGVESSSHYIPLHQSTFGKEVGEFRGVDVNTSTESNKLLRLPLHLGLSKEDVVFVSSCIANFYLAKS